MLKEGIKVELQNSDDADEKKDNRKTIPSKYPFYYTGRLYMIFMYLNIYSQKLSYA
jgi:hypothetical protein